MKKTTDFILAALTLMLPVASLILASQGSHYMWSMLLAWAIVATIYTITIE